MVQTNAPARAAWLIKKLSLDAPLQVADIGARITKEIPVYKPLLDHGVAHLHGFEPEPAAFAELEAAAGDNVSVYPVAVGKPGPATFYAHHIGALSSVFKFCGSAARYLGKAFWVNRSVTEHAMTLVALDQIDDLPPLDVLKMDVQGAELDVMEGARARLADCVMIIPEVRFYRMYEDEPMWADVDQEMRAQGFVLHKFLHQKSVVLPSSQKTNFHKRAASQLLDGDAVYIRNLEDTDALSDRQLKALALAADIVAQSHDLCAFCLDALAARKVIRPNLTQQYLMRVPPILKVAEDPAPAKTDAIAETGNV